MKSGLRILVAKHLVSVENREFNLFWCWGYDQIGVESDGYDARGSLGANRLTANAASPIVDGDDLYILSGSIIKYADVTTGDCVGKSV